MVIRYPIKNIKTVVEGFERGMAYQGDMDRREIIDGNNLRGKEGLR